MWRRSLSWSCAWVFLSSSYLIFSPNISAISWKQMEVFKCFWMCFALMNLRMSDVSITHHDLHKNTSIVLAFECSIIIKPWGYVCLNTAQGRMWFYFYLMLFSFFASKTIPNYIELMHRLTQNVGFSSHDIWIWDVIHVSVASDCLKIICLVMLHFRRMVW